jgi:predicted amidohydrolase YtcJ
MPVSNARKMTPIPHPTTDEVLVMLKKNLSRLSWPPVFAVFLAFAGCASDDGATGHGPESAADPVAVGDASSTLFVGPRFVTLDPALPEAAAILVDASGIIIERFAQVPATTTPWQVVQLPGQLAVPGLHDAHAHLSGVGKNLESVDLLGCRSPAEIAERVRAFLAENPNVPAVTGRGWDQSLFANKQFPRAADLSELGEKPMLLSRVDGHAALANSALLELAGIQASTPAPPGGRIEKDRKGNPTGVFVDNAIDLVARHLPAPTQADRMRWLQNGMSEARRAGLVAVHDMGMGIETYRALLALQEQGPLPIRVYVYLEGSPAGLAELEKAADEKRNASAHVTLMGIKMLADGAMGSRGAALLEPYSDDPKNSGLLTMEGKVLAAHLQKAQSLGFQVAIHAIGDRANREVLEAFEKHPPKMGGLFHRVEHAQLVHPEDFARFKKARAVASMQPTHATSDMRWAEARVGKDRLPGAYAWRRMLENEITLAFGSDAPVESIQPGWGLYAAITRQDHQGEPLGGFTPNQRLSAEEALAAFSLGGARALGKAGEMGSLVAGKVFDLTVFDTDPRQEAALWLKAQATATALSGKVHHLN